MSPGTFKMLTNASWPHSFLGIAHIYTHKHTPTQYTHECRVVVG